MTLLAEKNELRFAVPGGLIGVGTRESGAFFVWVMVPVWSRRLLALPSKAAEAFERARGARAEGGRARGSASFSTRLCRPSPLRRVRRTVAAAQAPRVDLLGPFAWVGPKKKQRRTRA